MTHFCPPPSPSISEGALGEFDANDHLVSAAFEALKACRIAAQSTHAACSAVHADTTLSEGARDVSAHDVAGKVIARPLPLVDRAGTNLQAEIARIENKVKAPVADTTVKGVNLGHEVRLYLRGLSPDGKRKAIVGSIESGDDSVISAILSAPPMLSGLSPQEIEAFALTWRTRKFPAELKRKSYLEGVSKALRLGGQLLVGYGQKMSAAAIVAEARKFREASVAAIAQATGSN
jgi:hypothetical protein